jgi:putative membrane protein insertion efficiency factor
MIARALDMAIRGYQILLSPFLGGHCRFHPTCSEYARRGIAEHGAARGSLLAVRRILRCHPLSRGGFDPVPPKHG